MGSCAAPSAKGDDKFITTDYLQQCRKLRRRTVTVRSIQRPAQPRQCVQADIGLDALARLCRALDAADGDGASAQLAVLRQLVERRREALASLEMQLAAMPTEPAQHAESLP
ncbi:hypothetical protein [Klebsiella pneumoniae]|uniref:hypothetical protein n=1 Tax=Klebsiella pneumoniae TaxID=573 RepID=UPI003F5CF2B9